MAHVRASVVTRAQALPTDAHQLANCRGRGWLYLHGPFHITDRPFTLLQLSAIKRIAVLLSWAFELCVYMENAHEG